MQSANALKPKKLINQEAIMSKMKRVAIFLLLLMFLPYAYADWFYNSEYVIVNVSLSSDAEIVPLAPSGYVEKATVNMTFYPRQTLSQQLLKFHTKPLAELEDETLKFSWERPVDKIEFSLNADVKVANILIPVREKIRFPLERLPETVIEYVKPSKTIDSDDEEITKIASELVKGEDDLYSAVFKIADWTKSNIEYNLSTLTADVSQKASWVLENKQGVCDELTSLFISMLRAVGVPARFVSGIAYTDSPLFPEKWGPHGWAEVYFPGYGWVPFDVTYGEFGWIDPTHVKFKAAIDPDEPSTYYQWLGRNVDLKTKDLNINAELIEKEGYSKVPLDLEAMPLKKAVGFDSYNLITASIKNPNDFYYSTELYLNMPREVEIIGSETKSILLLPGEAKKVFWVVKVDSNLDKRYSYTFPVIASTVNNMTAATSFVSNVRENHVAYEDLQPYIITLAEEKEKAYSGNVMLDCTINKTEFYTDDYAAFNCYVKNTGNVFLEDVEICFENRCGTADLGISQEKSFTFEIDTSKVGSKDESVTLKNSLISKVQAVHFKVQDIPEIKIDEIAYPPNVSYNENFTVYFTIAKISNSNPKNVHISLDVNGIQKAWDLDELDADRKFAVKFSGSQLKFGENSFKINADYFDESGKKYKKSAEFNVILPKATFSQKLVLAFNSIGASFERIGALKLSLMLFAGAVAFFVTVWLLLRKGKDEE